MRPLWSPDLEPTAETSRILAALVPRKLICVSGLAVSVSGSGETSTFVSGSAALCAIDAGRHVGERALSVAVVCVREDPQPLRSAATVTPAMAAISREMYPLLLMASMDGHTAGHDDGRERARPRATLHLRRYPPGLDRKS